MISVKNVGVRKQRMSDKNMFYTLKNNYFGKNRGCPKTKGVRKHNITAILSNACFLGNYVKGKHKFEETYAKIHIKCAF